MKTVAEYEKELRSLAMPLWGRVLHHLGKPVAEHGATVREFWHLLRAVLIRLPRRPWRRHEIAISVVHIGIGSMPIITIATAFAGLVVTNEIAWHMREALGTISMIPGFTAQFILRELGIAIPALLLTAKVGASITAEVGTMKVTEQIDALRLLGIDPVDYLVFPRFVASVFATACLTLFAVAVTMGCAISVAIVRYNFSILEYLNAVRHFIGLADIVCALVKGMVFGGIIPIISCAYGFRCKPGAEGVGTATTNAVVASTIAIILLDFVLTYLFSLVL